MISLVGDLEDFDSLDFESSRTREKYAPRRPGEAIGCFTIVKQIGEGGCGCVYLATCNHLRPFALKVEYVDSSHTGLLREKNSYGTTP
jgi:hypothetical protein